MRQAVHRARTRMFVLGLIGFVIGTVLGSFAKALADRSLENRTFWGRSYCPKCKKTLKWYDLLPVISYLLSKGQCRYCEKKIGIGYLLSEVITGVLIGYLLISQAPDLILSLTAPFKLVIVILELVLKALFITVLVAVTITDLKKTLIPDKIVLPAILISFVTLVVLAVYQIGLLYYSLAQSTLGKFLLPPHSNYFFRHALITAESLLSAILASLIMAGFFLALIVITKGRGMGGGDLKLGALIGIVLGSPNFIVALVGAFISGTVYALVLILFKKKSFGETIPFGPFLVLGSLAALYWGDKILSWYLKF